MDTTPQKTSRKPALFRIPMLASLAAAIRQHNAVALKVRDTTPAPFVPNNGNLNGYYLNTPERGWRKARGQRKHALRVAKMKTSRRSRS